MIGRGVSMGLVDAAVGRARMVLALVILSIVGGVLAYTSLPKEGSPNIDIPVLYISAPLPGVSAADSERLLVKPMEVKLRSLEGLKEMTGIAAEGYASMLLEFDFGWDKTATLAEVRALMDEAQAEFPDDAEEPTINELNLSTFPVLVVTLSGDAPERAMQRVAKNLQRQLESLEPVLEVGLAGWRNEMVEVVVDPLQLEAYDVTAQELLRVVSANNRLVAAGAVETASGRFALRVPGNFETPQEILSTPVRAEGDRVVTIGDIAVIRRVFEDPVGHARYNGQDTIALQVKKRLGYNILDTVAAVKAKVAEVEASWPKALRAGIDVETSMDQSVEVRDMVSQLEGSVILAVLLVMLVVVLTLGMRSALLVGLSIPLSFLLCFALLAAFGMSVNNMVMFGLILAVGMLVDGGIVVTEYADRRLRAGDPPAEAYAAAARRMFWPITASTATTLCAFAPMLLWPGMPGQFMGQLPITLIFVLSASLIVALIFLPVLGGLTARLGAGAAGALRRVGLARAPRPAPVARPHRRTAFGRVVAAVVGRWWGPILAIAAAFGAIVVVIGVFAENNRGVEFFVDTEPQRGMIHVRARGNLSVAEKDALVRAVEERVLGTEGVRSIFAFSGDGGLEGDDSGAPSDAIGQIQFELESWGARPSGDAVLAELAARAAGVPGVAVEVAEQQEGPEQGKPIQIRLEALDWDALQAAAGVLSDRLRAMEGLRDVEDTRPLPGIDWRLVVDRNLAGRFGADVESIGAIITLVTRGALLDVIRPDDAEEELEIRARFPDDARTLETLRGLKIRTPAGLVPLGAFVTLEPEPSLRQITRRDGVRYLLVKADVDPGVNANAKIAEIVAGLDADPLEGVRPALQGDQEEQAESGAFLMKAMLGALGLMFAILLAQFNSLYNAVLVLSAVVMSVAGVLVGMLVMGQPFSIIMTGTGVLALAGIVVNNNIVLIDTYRELSRSLPPLEAIIRSAETRIRPVLLTTVTTMAGLAPMMVAASIDFAAVPAALAALLAAGPLSAAAWSGFHAAVVSIGAPVALWWTQLATAVVFGLGVATVLTLLVTPSALALRVWLWRGLGALAGRSAAADRALRRRMARMAPPEIAWVEPDAPPLLRPTRYAAAAE